MRSHLSTLATVLGNPVEQGIQHQLQQEEIQSRQLASDLLKRLYVPLR
jgi:hypothetical protein